MNIVIIRIRACLLVVGYGAHRAQYAPTNHNGNVIKMKLRQTPLFVGMGHAAPMNPAFVRSLPGKAVRIIAFYPPGEAAEVFFRPAVQQAVKPLGKIFAENRTASGGAKFHRGRKHPH